MNLVGRVAYTCSEILRRAPILSLSFCGNLVMHYPPASTAAFTSHTPCRQRFGAKGWRRITGKLKLEHIDAEELDVSSEQQSGQA